MNKLFFILMLLGCLLFNTKGSGQTNLVPNPSFEELDSCDWDIGIISSTSYWNDPNEGSSDLFNVCNDNVSLNVPLNGVGYQYPKSGLGYCGISIYLHDNPFDYREYLQVELLEPLIENYTYKVEFYVSLADFLYAGDFASDCLSIYLSTELIASEPQQIIDVEPQINSQEIITDKLGWTKISGDFIAEGGEKYITIGCFDSDNQINLLSVVKDSSIIPFQSYYYIDDVSVEFESVVYSIDVPNILTPNCDGRNDYFLFELVGYMGVKVRIYNRWGLEILTSNDSNFKWNGDGYSEGVYFYLLELERIDHSKDYKKGYVQLIR